MKEQEKVFRELKKVTRELIRCGLAEEYNYPVIQQMDIVWEKYQNISLYLRNMDYSTIYDEIEKMLPLSPSLGKAYLQKRAKRQVF